MKLSLQSKQALEGGVVQFTWGADKIPSWQPGQYIHYQLPHESVDDRGAERWFTISSAPAEGRVAFTTRMNGQPRSSFKNKLAELKIGDIIDADQPEGDFVLDDQPRDYVFVIGGIGITPLRSMIAALTDSDAVPRMEILYANRSAESVPFRGELEAFAAKHDGVNITYFFDGNRIDAAALKTAGAKLNQPIYFVSGPEKMTEAFEKTLADIGIDAVHSRFDYFPGYDHEL